MLSPRHCSSTEDAPGFLTLPLSATDDESGIAGSVTNTASRSSPSPRRQRPRPRLDTKRSTSSEITSLFKSTSPDSDLEETRQEYLGAMQCAGCFPYDVDPLCFADSPQSIVSLESIDSPGHFSGRAPIGSRCEDSGISGQFPELDHIRAKLKTPMRAPSFTFSSPISPDDAGTGKDTPLGAVRVQPGIIVCGNERWLVRSRCHTPQMCPMSSEPPRTDADGEEWRSTQLTAGCPAPSPRAQMTSRRPSKTTPITCLDNTTVAVEPASQCKSSTKTGPPTAISSITTLNATSASVRPVKTHNSMPPDYFPDAGDTWIAGFYKHMRLWSRAQFDIEAATTETTIDEARRRALRASRRMMLYLDRAVQVSVTEREEELGLCCDVCAVQAEGSPSSAPTGTKSTRGTDECDDSFCECAE